MSFISKIRGYFNKKEKSISNIFDAEDMVANSIGFNSGLGFLDLYTYNLYVNKALDLRARKVGQVDFYLYDLKKKEAIEEHPILDLIYKPNPFHSKTEFFTLVQKFKDVYGSAYIQLMRARKSPFDDNAKIDSMYVLPTKSVKELVNKETGAIEFYEYTKPDHTKVNIPAADIIALHRYDISSLTKGVSIMKSGRREIETGSQLVDFQSAILKNGGKIDGVFNFKNTVKLSKEQLVEIKAQYKKEFAEAKKAGMPLFMAGDTDYKRTSLTPEELNYIESKKANLGDISIMSGVPKTLLGNYDEVKFDNADASNIIFLRETIKPEVDNLFDKLNTVEDLSPKDYELRYYEFIPEDTDKKLKVNESGIKNYYITPNEARAEIGKEPIEGGDQLYIPFSVLPQSDIAPDDQPGQAKSKRHIFVHPLKDVETRQMYSKIYTKRTDRRENVFKSRLNAYFNGQESRIIEKLKVRKSFKKKDLVDDVWATDLEIKLAFEAMLPAMEQVLKEAGKDVLELMNYDYDFNVTPQIRGWLDNKAHIFAEQINETTFKKLKREFEDSLAAGEGRDELVDRVKATYREISKGRAQVIARTEVHGVSQYGQFNGYKQMGVPIKIYVWSPGIKGGARDEHQSMDGEEVPINQHFSNGLMYPGEDGAPAEETINCQCTI